MIDHARNYNCERCGDSIPLGCECGPAADMQFLCEGCYEKVRGLPQVAAAKFIGIQPGFGDMSPLALFNLEDDIPGHCAKSTVTRNSVEAAGYRLPEDELAKASDALLNHMARKRCIHSEAV